MTSENKFGMLRKLLRALMARHDGFTDEELDLCA